MKVILFKKINERSALLEDGSLLKINGLQCVRSAFIGYGLIDDEGVLIDKISCLDNTVVSKLNRLPIPFSP